MYTSGTRCMFYDDDGVPIDKGCPRRTQGICAFVHPGDEYWQEASRDKLATSRREMHPDWDNSGWDFTKSNHSNRGTRHKYNSSRRPRFQDYEDSDDRHKHKVDVREGENLARTTTSFLAKDKSLPWGSRPDSGWHMTGKDSPEPWGITATDGGTGASWDAVCTTWGQPDQTGQPGAVPARPTTLTTTFLDVITPSPITSLSGKGRGKEKMKVDAMYEDKEVLRGLGLDLEVINTSVPVLEEPMGAIDPIPSKFATPSPSADWLKIPTGQRVKATRKRSDQGSLKCIPTVHENLTLKGLYEKHIRGLYDAICIKTELEKIVQDEERWRRTRGSELYSRTSPWNKATVMHHRNVKNQKRIETEKRSQEIISNCAPYPELPPSNYYNLISVSNLEGIIMGYVSEIREWIESLQIHLHIPPTEDPDADQEIEGSSSKKLSPWEQLKITLNDIDSELEAMIMDFYSKQYLENIDVEEHVEKLLNDAIQKLRDVDAAQNELGAKGASVSKNEQTLAAQADLAAKLLEKIMMDEKEVKILRAEKDANRQLERKIGNLFAEMEQEQKEYLCRIEKLRQQIQWIHEHRPSLAHTDLNELVSLAKAQVVDKVIQDVQNILAHFKQHAKSIDEKVVKHLDKLVTPIVNDTNDLMQSLATTTSAAV